MDRPDLGLRVVRGGTVRGVGYFVGALMMAASSVVLLRYLGVADFGRFTAVLSLMAIVGGVTDAGLTTIATREVALLGEGFGRQSLLANLLGLRLVIAPIGVAAGVAFAIAAGYDWSLVVGAALVGIGVVLTAAQAAIALPLTVDLQVGRVAALDMLRQGGMLIGVAVLAAAHFSLVPFFVIPAAAAGLALAVTPTLVGRGAALLPKFDRDSWRALIRESMPTAASLVMNIIYFRVLIVLMSVVATAVQTGLFATSFRIFELLFGVSALVIGVGLPALAVAAADRQRLRYMLQRMIEVSTFASCYFVVIVVIVARPALILLGGAQYAAAAPVMRVQIFALIPVFVGQAIQAALISVRRQRAQAVANGIGLLVVLAAGAILVPWLGAKGGAIAAVIAECGLTGALVAVLRRSEPVLSIHFGFLWKVALASGLALAPLLISQGHEAVAAVAATCVYVVVLFVTRAVPPEVVDAIGLRRWR